MATITRPQFLEWMVWAKVRGPIGQPRRDYYASFVAMHAGKPYDKPVSLADDQFRHWWMPPEENDERED